MRYIHKIFHEKNVKEFDEVYRQRIRFDSVVHMNLEIKPMDQPQTYSLYYIPTNEMLEMVTQIHCVSNSFERAFDALPPIARNQFLNECIVEELFNTNDLEGIRSTREEIARSAKEVKLNRKSKQRFESMIKLYMKLIGNGLEYPLEPRDIRKIYDDITDGEIEQEELQDGQLFRRDTTYILKKSGSGKVVHQGITPESAIVDAMHQLLRFMNENRDIPDIIKVAIGHYFFGYIHPFYDGNGRTSRFISSMYLSKVMGNVSTLSLSRGCNKYKNKYLESFEITNSIRSRGEMNCFIETFLKIIIRALNDMTAELKEKSQLLQMAHERIMNEPLLKDDDYRSILFVMAQNYFFDAGSGLTVKELADIFDKSEATTRKAMKELTSLSLVEQKGERPAYFCIKKNYFQS